MCWLCGNPGVQHLGGGFWSFLVSVLPLAAYYARRTLRRAVRLLGGG